MHKSYKYIFYCIFTIFFFLQNSGIFYVYSGTVNPNIYSRFPDQDDLLPIGNFDMVYEIDDTISGINTSSENMILQKWDGVSAWGSDIAGTYQIGQNITTTQASYTIMGLPYGKYRSTFSINDNNGNNTTAFTIFYVDAPAFIISTPEYDIGDIMIGTDTFGIGELEIQVETVGAKFDVDMLKTALLEKEPGIDIIDWNGTEGFGYDQETYSGAISIINSTENIASQTGSINTNGDKNIYTYKLKYGALVLSDETIAGDYEVDIDFNVEFMYADVDDRCRLDGIRSFTCSL